MKILCFIKNLLLAWAVLNDLFYVFLRIFSVTLSLNIQFCIIGIFFKIGVGFALSESFKCSYHQISF